MCLSCAVTLTRMKRIAYHTHWGRMDKAVVRVLLPRSFPGTFQVMISDNVAKTGGVMLGEGPENQLTPTPEETQGEPVLKLVVPCLA